MTDGDIRVAADLPTADRAVKYLLDRIQVDPDLRHHMLHTEAMGLLVKAEAERLGLSEEAVMGLRMGPRQEGGLPKLVLARREIERLREKHDDWE